MPVCVSVCLLTGVVWVLNQVGDIKNLFAKESATWPDALTWVAIDKLTSGRFKF